MNTRRNFTLGVAAGLLMLSGCASTAYLVTAASEPDEVPSGSAKSFPGMRRRYFNATCADLEFPLVMAMAGRSDWCGAAAVPFAVVDLPFSICTDVVTMPWQARRHSRIFEPWRLKSDDRVTRGMVHEILEWLKTQQAETGEIKGGKSELVNTGLTVLELLHRGVGPGYACLKCDQDLACMCGKGVDYLVNMAHGGANGTQVAFNGEEKDPRAFIIAANALVSAHGYKKCDLKLREIAEQCATRAAGWVKEIQDKGLDEESADVLRWTVITLQDAIDINLNVENLGTQLECARAKLSEWGKADNGYFEAWDKYRNFYIVSSEEASRDWCDFFKARRKAVAASLEVCGICKDGDGKSCWMSMVVPCKEGIAASGLGQAADAALAALQITWTRATRPPPTEEQKRRLSEPTTSDGVSIDI